jgi:hypothetical protein
MGAFLPCRRKGLIEFWFPGPIKQNLLDMRGSNRNVDQKRDKGISN